MYGAIEVQEEASKEMVVSEMIPMDVWDEWTNWRIDSRIVIDNGEDAGAGLQECRWIDDTMIWIHVVSSCIYCTAEPRYGC